MELVESIETINEQLRRTYGIDSISSRPIYRVVWANDELEKRLMHFTDAGIQLLTPEIREVPKYTQWAKDRYILRTIKLCQKLIAPEKMQMTVSKVSYEPIWSFVDNKLNYLPPRFEVAKVVIDTVACSYSW
jgi:hypothetical protein